MIVAVTPNPSVDRALEIDGLHRGDIVRSRSRRVEPGGKGINVVRALAGLGVLAEAVVPVGGAEGRQLVELLEFHGIRPRTVPIGGPVRANVSLVEPDGTVTKVNEPGPVLTAAELAELLAVTADLAGGAAWVVTCGSLPAGAPDDLHAQVVRRARAAGARTAVDTSGQPLLAALEAAPDLIKPNLDELAQATGGPLTTLGDTVVAARKLQALGAGTVLASLGADGAVLVTGDDAWHGTCPVDHPVSSVGAGDATLAGYLSAADARPADALRTAVAFGAAAVQLPGTSMPGPDDLHPELVRVTDVVDLDRALTSARRGEDGLRAAETRT